MDFYTECKKIMKIEKIFKVEEIPDHYMFKTIKTNVKYIITSDGFGDDKSLVVLDYSDMYSGSKAFKKLLCKYHLDFDWFNYGTAYIFEEEEEEEDI